MKLMQQHDSIDFNNCGILSTCRAGASIVQKLQEALVEEATFSVMANKDAWAGVMSFNRVLGCFGYSEGVVKAFTGLVNWLCLLELTVSVKCLALSQDPRSHESSKET